MVPSHSDPLQHFSYVWEHLDVGYVQGMCDLLAPLLVILDNGEEVGEWSLNGVGMGLTQAGERKQK